MTPTGAIDYPFELNAYRRMESAVSVERWIVKVWVVVVAFFVFVKA